MCYMENAIDCMVIASLMVYRACEGKTNNIRFSIYIQAISTFLVQEFVVLVTMETVL